jgi:hypothetical protein
MVLSGAKFCLSTIEYLALLVSNIEKQGGCHEKAVWLCPLGSNTPRDKAMAYSIARNTP